MVPRFDLAGSGNEHERQVVADFERADTDVAQRLHDGSLNEWEAPRLREASTSFSAACEAVPVQSLTFATVCQRLPAGL